MRIKMKQLRQKEASLVVPVDSVWVMLRAAPTDRTVSRSKPHKGKGKRKLGPMPLENRKEAAGMLVRLTANRTLPSLTIWFILTQ